MSTNVVSTTALLCTKMTRVSILVISLITSFNVTSVTSNTCLCCPDPHSLKHITNHDSCFLIASTSVMILPRWLFMSLGGVLNSFQAVSWTLCSWDTIAEKKIISWGWVREPWWPLCVIIQRNYPVVEEFPQSASTINAWKLHAAAVQSVSASEGQFLHLSWGETAHHWDYLCSAVQNWTFKPYQKTEKTNSWSVIAMIKSGTEALKQEFMKPPVTSHPHQ